MIAMATHGRGGLARLVMGSVATSVLQQASVPLLLVRPAAAEHRSTCQAVEGGRHRNDPLTPVGLQFYQLRV